MLLREIIKPTEPDITVRLPKEMVGKMVELIAFDIEEVSTKTNREEKLRNIQALTQQSQTDLSSFTFNRDEANDYD